MGKNGRAKKTACQCSVIRQNQVQGKVVILQGGHGTESALKKMPAFGAYEIHQTDRVEDSKLLRGSEHSKDKYLHAGFWLTVALPLLREQWLHIWGSCMMVA